MLVDTDVSIYYGVEMKLKGTFPVKKYLKHSNRSLLSVRGIYFLLSCAFTFYPVAHLLSTQLRIYFLLSCAFTFYWTGHQPLPPELGISDSGDG